MKTSDFARRRELGFRPFGQDAQTDALYINGMIERDKDARLATLEDFHAAIVIELDNFDSAWQVSNRASHDENEATVAARAIFHMAEALRMHKSLVADKSKHLRWMQENRDHWRKVAHEAANEPHSLWWHIKRWNRTRIRLPVRDGGPK